MLRGYELVRVGKSTKVRKGKSRCDIVKEMKEI